MHLFPQRDLSKKSGRLSKKADDLCNKGDAIGGAEGRRILRECRRYRGLAVKAKEEEDKNEQYGKHQSC